MPTNSNPASTFRLLTVHGSRYTCSIIDPPYGLGDLGALCRYMRVLLPAVSGVFLSSRPSAASSENGMRSGRSDQASATKLFNWPPIGCFGSGPDTRHLCRTCARRVHLSDFNTTQDCYMIPHDS